MEKVRVVKCRYCDRPEGLYGIPITVDDEEICACGAEWADARIVAEEDFDEEEANRQEYREYVRQGPFGNEEIQDEEDDDYELWAYEQE